MPEITETKLKEQIAKEQIGSLYFLYGDEKLLVRRNLNRLLKKLDGNFPEFNFQEFPHDAPVDSIADAVVAMPFMAERKCVTVSDLNVEAMNTAELDKLYELLDTIPETTVLILYLPTLEIDPKKSAKWRTFLKKLDTRGFSLPSLRLKDNELEKYVCREAEKANCLLSRKLAERIVQYVGNDLNALTNEVTKLCAFAGGGEITAEQVEKTVTKNMETTVFLLSNALVRGDYSKAYALLDLLMAQCEEPYTILAVLSSAYIDMYRVRAAIESGKTSMAPTEYGDYRGRDFRLKYAERDVRDLSIEMLMIHMNEALIVEGRYDKSKLSALTDAIIVTTNGFGIYKDAEKRDFIRKLAKERGIVILTDSDNAGRQIRAYITSFVPSNQIRHAYIPDIYGKEKRKAAPSKEGKLGVEGISSEILLEILKEAGASVEGSTTDFQPLTPADLMSLGLTGGVNSATLRQGVLKALDLPENLTTKMFLRWVTSEEKKAQLLAAVEKIKNGA